MAAWSEEEIERTLEEIRKLSVTDSDFRQLALTDPVTAIAKVNPHPLPQGYDVRFLDTDPDFRELALSDSAAAISKVNPKPVPDDYKVKFVDNSGPVKNFVLPDPVNNVEDLSDAELEAVAGGISTRNNANIA